MEGGRFNIGINVTDYRYLFDEMFGNNDKGKSALTMKSSALSTKAGQAQLRAAGIDTNSAQYKAAMKRMQSAGGVGNVNIQGIKNLMSSFDENGGFIIQGGPFAGISGLVVNEENASKRTKGTVSISDSIKEEMFETLKRNLQRENGTVLKAKMVQQIVLKSTQSYTRALRRMID